MGRERVPKVGPHAQWKIILRIDPGIRQPNENERKCKFSKDDSNFMRKTKRKLSQTIFILIRRILLSVKNGKHFYLDGFFFF